MLLHVLFKVQARTRARAFSIILSFSDTYCTHISTSAAAYITKVGGTRARVRVRAHSFSLSFPLVLSLTLSLTLSLALSLALSHLVTLTAHTSAPALQHMSFKVEAGTHAAFFGPAGSGKSVLLALIERYVVACALQCRCSVVAVSCSVLQCVAVVCSGKSVLLVFIERYVAAVSLQCVAVCSSVLQWHVGVPCTC